ncbi:MAG: ubiquinone biosynthesis protein UbiB, partial [Gammaproteobacteria bacterium]
MLWETLSVVRDLPRLHEIASVLIRYGWGDLVRVLGISGVLERAGRVLHWQHASEISQLEPPVRIRRALEELGPTFVKLGQL